MKNFILTGAPGSGKTTLINELEKLGYGVVREAATDLIIKEQKKGILEPWKSLEFIMMSGKPFPLGERWIGQKAH